MKSLVTKIAGLIVIAFIAIVGIGIFFNYKNITDDSIKVFHVLQESILKASYTTINITMNIEAEQHLKFIANEI